MGLDMYLSARKYINKIDWDLLDRNSDSDTRYANAITPEYRNVVDMAGMSHIQDDNDVYGAHVQVNCLYWRKVNAVHNWFVENVQDNVDNCHEYYVSQNKLIELLDTCKEAYKNRDPKLIPPQDGFFFGGTDINEWYWAGIKYTIDELERITELPEFSDLSFYYQSSW